MCLCLDLNEHFSYPGEVDGQFTPAPSTCPNDTITFTCTVNGDITGITTWKVGRGSDNQCALVHRVTNIAICGQGNTFNATPGAGFGTDGPTFTSTLSVTATHALDGTLVECFGPANNVDSGNMVGNSTLKIVGQCVLLTRNSYWYVRIILSEMVSYQGILFLIKDGMGRI